MKKFFSDLLSGSNETSSKRFAALVTLGNVLILSYLAAWKNNWVLPVYMFNGLCLIIGGGLGLTVIEKIFTPKQEPVPDQTVTTETNINIQTTGTTEG